MKAKLINTQVFSRLAVVFLWCFLASLLLAIVLVESYENALGSDFVSFLTGARIVREGKGAYLYDLAVQHEYQLKLAWPHKEASILPFRNPPPFAVLFIPFTFSPLLTVYKLYSLLLVGVAFLTSYLALKAFKNLKGSLWFILPLIFYPSFGSIFAGQLSLFLLLIFVLIYISVKKGNAFVTGILAGILFLKIQYLVSVPFIFFLLKDKKNFLKGLSLTAFFLVVLSVIISGQNFVKDYLNLLSLTQNEQFGTRVENMFTFYSTLAQTPYISQVSTVALFTLNLIFYLVALLLFKRKLNDHSLSQNFSILVLLTLVFCFHGINHDLALLVLPTWIAIDHIRSTKKPELNLVLATFLLILLPLLYVVKLSALVSLVILFCVNLNFLSKSNKLHNSSQ